MRKANQIISMSLLVLSLQTGCQKIEGLLPEIQAIQDSTTNQASASNSLSGESSEVHPILGLLPEMASQANTFSATQKFNFEGEAFDVLLGEMDFSSEHSNQDTVAYPQEEGQQAYLIHHELQPWLIKMRACQESLRLYDPQSGQTLENPYELALENHEAQTRSQVYALPGGEQVFRLEAFDGSLIREEINYCAPRALAESETENGERYALEEHEGLQHFMHYDTQGELLLEQALDQEHSVLISHDELTATDVLLIEPPASPASLLLLNANAQIMLQQVVPIQAGVLAKARDQQGNSYVMERNAQGQTLLIVRNTQGQVIRKKVMSPQRASASSRDPQSGRTTTVVDNGNGTRTVTISDKGGKVVKVKKLKKKSLADASSFDHQTGLTTRVQDNGDGTKTITVRDQNGKLRSKVTKPLRAPKKPLARPAQKTFISAFDPQSGRTTTVVDNGNGTKTITVTDQNGQQLSSVTQNK